MVWNSETKMYVLDLIQEVSRIQHLLFSRKKKLLIANMRKC